NEGFDPSQLPRFSSFPPSAVPGHVSPSTSAASASPTAAVPNTTAIPTTLSTTPAAAASSTTNTTSPQTSTNTSTTTPNPLSSPGSDLAPVQQWLFGGGSGEGLSGGSGGTSPLPPPVGSRATKEQFQVQPQVLGRLITLLNTIYSRCRKYKRLL